MAEKPNQATSISVVAHAQELPSPLPPPEHKTLERCSNGSLHFLMFFVTLFICIISTIIMMICMGNFVMIYQTRHTLLEFLSSESQSNSTTEFSSSTAFPITTVISSMPPSSLPPQTEPTVSISSPTTIAKSTESSTSLTIGTIGSSSLTSSSSSPTSTTEEFTTTSDFTLSSSTDYQTTPRPKKRDPVVILNEIYRGTNYTCYEICLDPLIKLAEANVSLSHTPNNYLLLNIKVATRSVNIAKRRVAYWVLSYLHKDRLNEAETDPDWSKEVLSCKKLVMRKMNC